MNFQDAIIKIKTVLEKIGITIDSNDYDGIVVKKLAASNTLDEGRTTNQTHIAITGDQMDLFPYARAEGYFEKEYQDKDDDLKKYFVAQVPVYLYKQNILYLDNSAELISNDKELVYCSTVRSRRDGAADQMQLSMTNLDSATFVEFRRLVHTGCFLIFLKQKEELIYDLFAVKGQDADGIVELNNHFYKMNTTTKLKIDQLEQNTAGKKLTPEWFNEKGIPLAYMDDELEERAEKFVNKFGPDVLQALDGETLLETIFLNGKNKDNLCYELEYDNQLIQLAGSIKGGSAYKYGLFFNQKENSWVTGSSRKPQKLSMEEAVEVGTEIRDCLLAGQAVIEEFGEPNSLDDYEKLYVELNVATNGNIAKSWFMKYYFLLNPSVISPNYTLWAQNTFVKALGIEPGDNPITRMGQLQLFNKRCEVSPIVFSTVFWKNFDAAEEGEQEMNEVEKVIPVKFNTGYKSSYQRNRILFGAPGTGKSFTVNKDKNELLKHGGEYERVTFHPDYTYANFVGTYKPVPSIDSMGNDVITYEYVPGPFMRTLVKALENGRTEAVEPFLLIVEEINRANVAAVFGDVFQLLDRVDNVSEYPIQASEDIRKYMAKELGGEPADYTTIQIPDNMFIWATMNSADQGVFPMDTAFKRRWDFTYLSINTNEEKIIGKSITLGTGSDLRVVEWNKLRKAINEELVTYKINEDKLLGTFFIPKDRVPGGDNFTEEEFKRIFKNKVIMYLFEDAARQKAPTLFAGCKKKLYSEICDSFDTMGVNIFCDNIRNKFATEEE